jgi:hypothetical protein
MSHVFTCIFITRGLTEAHLIPLLIEQEVEVIFFTELILREVCKAREEHFNI